MTDLHRDLAVADLYLAVDWDVVFLVLVLYVDEDVVSAPLVGPGTECWGRGR